MARGGVQHKKINKKRLKSLIDKGLAVFWSCLSDKVGKAEIGDEK